MNTVYLGNISEAVADSLAELVERVQASTVVVHNGRRGVGAGVILQPDGLIVTNRHVVAHAGGRLRVSLADGRELPARLLAEDPEVDLAALKVESDGLLAASVGDSQALRVGQLVLAVGHPWGQRGFITAGLVSGLGKARTGGRRGEVEVIRSDVVLAPGNSGGPLVDARGAVVGINTMVIGGDLGLAVPSCLVAEFLRDLARRETAPNGRRPVSKTEELLL